MRVRTLEAMLHFLSHFGLSPVQVCAVQVCHFSQVTCLMEGLAGVLGSVESYLIATHVWLASVWA